MLNNGKLISSCENVVLSIDFSDNINSTKIEKEYQFLHFYNYFGNDNFRS